MEIPLRFVRVDWLDAHSRQGWEEASETEEKPSPVITVGFIVQDDKEVLVVASTYSPDDEKTHSTNCRMVIPRGMVKKITPLKLK